MAPKKRTTKAKAATDAAAADKVEAPKEDATKEPKKEEKKEEPKTEEKKEEPKKEEPKKEEPKKEEPKKEEPKKEEPKKEEPKKEEPKKEEPKKEEPKKEETPKSEAAMEVEQEEDGPKEQEADSPADKRKKVKSDAVRVSEVDSTVNVLVTAGGTMLKAFGEGGMQYLLASSRATAAVKAGRYMFEARILETLSYAEPQNSQQGRPPMPKQLFRVGFSIVGSSIFLADTEDSICFDSDGFFHEGKKRQKVGQKFGNDVVSVLLNLDQSSPNANTVSLFKKGVRVCPPQALPEHMRGKALVPTVTFRSVASEVNFGPAPIAPLPFACRMVADAAAEDVELLPTKSDGCEVVFPVGLPDQGLFSWMDAFLEKHPDYMELSDRKIIEWAGKSGIPAPKGNGSADKPGMAFGLPFMDDGSVRRVLYSVAPAVRRNYLIGELKANLVAEDRRATLARFGARGFKMSAVVVMGEPNKEYRDRVQADLLAKKVRKADAEKKRKAADAERKRLFEEKKRRAEEARKARLAKKDGAEAESAAGEEKEAPPVEDAKMQEDDAPIELTEEEKKIVHPVQDVPDLNDKVLAKSFTSFALPAKEEGFNEVRYEWQPAAKCAEVLTAYVRELKSTQRAEDLQPSDWFKERCAAWNKSLGEWRKKQNEWKDPMKKKAILAKKAEADKEAGKDPMKIDIDDLDVSTVEDVSDVGTGEPLFANFAFEDWALLGARYELHLLLHAFRKDLNDPERPSFQEQHLGFYYNKYYRKAFSVASFACDSFAKFVRLVKENIAVADGTGLLEALLPDDEPLAKFVQLTEIHRRDRQRRVDAGDETALLVFARTPTAPQSRPPIGGAASAGAQKRPWMGQAPMQPAAKFPRPAFPRARW